MSKDIAKLFEEAILRAPIGDVSGYVLLANNAFAIELRNLLKKRGLDIVVLSDPRVPMETVYFVNKFEIEKNGFVQINPSVY